LIAPLFFLLLFAIIEAGRFILYYEVLTNATREGARYAIVNGAGSEEVGCPTGPPAPQSENCDPDGSDVEQKVRDAAVGLLGTGVVVGRCWWYIEPETCDFATQGASTGGNNGRSAFVTVTATYTYTSLIPLVPLPNITVEAESSLVINN
jgi:TadE-like protein